MELAPILRGLKEIRHVNPEIPPNFADLELSRKPPPLHRRVELVLCNRRGIHPDYHSGIKPTALEFQYYLSSI